jgi:hypothetical protein
MKLKKAVWTVMEQEVEDGDAENGPNPNGPSIYYVPVHQNASFKKAQKYINRNRLRFARVEMVSRMFDRDVPDYVDQMATNGSSSFIRVI